MLKRTGYLYDDRYLLHNPGEWHPERPDRLRAIQSHLREMELLDLLEPLEPYPAPLEWVERLHEPGYIRRFQEACARGARIFEVPDCGICPESYDIALLAAGGVMAAVDAVMADRVDNAFAAVRPPGHHAEYDRAMGFCFFNNVAIGAIYLIERFGLERVAIVDWDVHHGNGTQHLFESDPRVFYLSIHEDPEYCYPGTGYRHEKGKGAGEGFTLNLPMPPRSGDREYLEVMEYEGIPRLKAFDPKFLLISAGFDAHRSDPLAHQNLTRRGYREMGEMLLNLAKEHCGGRVITVLEGGYNLEVLQNCVEEQLKLLLGWDFN